MLRLRCYMVLVPTMVQDMVLRCCLGHKVDRVSPYGKVPPCCLMHMPLPACLCCCPLEFRFFDLLLDSAVARSGRRHCCPHYLIVGMAHEAAAVDGNWRGCSFLLLFVEYVRKMY